MEQKEIKLEIKAVDAQAVLDYLTSKPFKEVFQLVNILTSLKPSEETKQA